MHRMKLIIFKKSKKPTNKIKEKETVLENSTPLGGDDFDLWDQNQMLRSKHRNYFDNSSKWRPGGCCKPSYIPITFILTLIVLVVLLPLLEHHNEQMLANAKGNLLPFLCTDQCSIQLVESIPEGLPYPPNSPIFLSTYDAWTQLLLLANSSLDIASFYWTMRKTDIYNHTSSWQGDKIFHSILSAGTESLKIRIAQNTPTQTQPNLDTEILLKQNAADVRSVNFQRLLGGGVLHTKLWLVDQKHMYLGSANMDWRSLTQIKELGVLITNCSCLVNDVAKIFEVYWSMGQDNAQIPSTWPKDLSTKYNITTPINVNFIDEHTYKVYFSSSPPPMSPQGRAQEIDAIVNIIQNAEQFIHISVMDYFPHTLYTPKIKYWPYIDDALRTAAIEHKVSIKLLISWWNHSRPAEDYFLRSLEDLSYSYVGVNIEVKRFIVPATSDQAKIPFARVNHNKYMVTDRTAYIGTSNWSGDYFTNTAGIGLILQDSFHDRYNNLTSIRSDLAAVFKRDWNSNYAVQLKRFK